MKSWFLLVLALWFVPVSYAQTPAPNTEQPAAVNAQQPLRSPRELEQLVAPIALYPDPLLALILPASTSPLDLVLAARRLRAGGDPAQMSGEKWDESVKALVHYPEVVKWLDENIEWTSALGDAFAAQGPGVMQAIQRERARAKAAGNLANTLRQEVVEDKGSILIEPAQPDSVSVPAYDPDVVYAPPPPDVSSSLVDYGTAYPAGGWLGYDCDWGAGGIWVTDAGSRRNHFRDHGHFWQLTPGRISSHSDSHLTGAIVPSPALNPRTPPIHRFGMGRVASGTTFQPNAAPSNQVSAPSISAPSRVSSSTVIVPNGSSVTETREVMTGNVATPAQVDRTLHRIESNQFPGTRFVPDRSIPSAAASARSEASSASRSSGGAAQSSTVGGSSGVVGGTQSSGLIGGGGHGGGGHR